MRHKGKVRRGRHQGRSASSDAALPLIHTLAPGGGQQLWFALAAGTLAIIFLMPTLRRLHRALVVGPSMAPALLDGDRVLVDYGAYRRARPCPGDIVLARVPSAPGGLVIKRVAAVSTGGRQGAFRPYTVRLLGDNTVWSTDSRHFGPVSADAIAGRVWYRYLPAERRGPIMRPSEQHGR